MTEAEGLEPPSGCPRRISSAVPYQLGLRLQCSVGTGGFEPPTPRSRSECSTGLSHVPNITPAADRLGFEPTRGLCPPHDFQSCSLSRSDTDPLATEGVGFEPTDALRASRFSKPLPWASRASLPIRIRATGGHISRTTRSRVSCPSRARTWT